MLECASACMANAGVVADMHLVLSDRGVKKRQHADFNLAGAQQVYAVEVLPAAQALREAMTAGPSMEPADVVAES